MTVGPDDFAHRLNEAKMAADRGESIDVTDWTKEQIAKRFFTDHGRIEKLVQIAAARGCRGRSRITGRHPRGRRRGSPGCAESPGRMTE